MTPPPPPPTPTPAPLLPPPSSPSSHPTATPPAQACVSGEPGLVGNVLTGGGRGGGGWAADGPGGCGAVRPAGRVATAPGACVAHATRPTWPPPRRGKRAAVRHLEPY